MEPSDIVLHGIEAHHLITMPVLEMHLTGICRKNSNGLRQRKIRRMGRSRWGQMRQNAALIIPDDCLCCCSLGSWRHWEVFGNINFKLLTGIVCVMMV